MAVGLGPQLSNFPALTIRAQFSGADAEDLQVGYAVCWDSDNATDASRGYVVEKPSSSNIKYFAGVIARVMGNTDPNDSTLRDVEIIPAGAISAGVTVWTDCNVARGDLLSPRPGTFALTKGELYANAVCRVDEAVDRSATAGTATGYWGPRSSLGVNFADQKYTETDFVDNHNPFNETAGGGTITLDAYGGEGCLTLTTNNSDNAETSVESDLVYSFAGDDPVYAIVEVELTEGNTDDANVFIGFTDDASDYLGNDGAGPKATGDHIGVFKVDGGTVWQAEASSAGTQDTDTDIGAVASGTKETFEFWYDGEGTATISKGGTVVDTYTTMPTGSDLKFVIAASAGGANAEVLEVDYVKIVQHK